jgi:PAS domain S-box-containing protein
MFSTYFLTSETRDLVTQWHSAYAYDYWLVVLSCLVAMFASYTAFHLITRVNAACRPTTKAAWLFTGAVSMGSGIWSMHFIAMLAVLMPGAVRYDIVLTGLSAVFAIIASGFAFYVATTGARTVARLAGGGTLLGAGIGAMHYTGMAGMQMDGKILYDPFMFAVSVLVAVSLSSVALRLLYQSVESIELPRQVLKLASGSVMGLSIAAMHYTAMGATYTFQTDHHSIIGLELNASLMAAIITVGALTIFGLALIASAVDQRMEIKNREAQQSESFLAAVVNNIADAIIAFDRNGVVQMSNPAADHMFGYGRSEFVGKNVSILLPPEELEAHEKHVRNSDLDESRVLGIRRALCGQRKDGSSIHVQISLTAMQSDKGRMFIGVCQDITERKRTEERMRMAMRHSELANRAKSEFLANMSHELRTPLNAIIGFSELIRGEIFGPLGSPKYLEYVRDINLSGTHLLALINDILDLSKIEAGKVDLYKSAVDVAAAVWSSLHLVGERAEVGGVKLETEIADNLPSLYADERKLKQILINLLSNAVKFTGVGGKVTVRVWSHPNDGYVLQISDTGIGIAPENIPRALAPFQQVDSDLNRQYEGTGLGLALSKSLVELHGGSLDLQSKVGIGTTVAVRFPAEMRTPVVARA